ARPRRWEGREDSRRGRPEPAGGADPRRGGAGGTGRVERSARPAAGAAAQRRDADGPQAPPVDEDVTPQLLDRAARAGLRTLTKDNADRVAKHLVMAGRLIDVDPERAYERSEERRVGEGGRWRRSRN